MTKKLFEITESKIRDNKLSGKYNVAWVEETAGIEGGNFNKNTIASKSYLGAGIDRKKIRWLLIIIILSMTVIAGRVAYLQIYKGEHYRSLSEGNRIRIKPIISERGMIYDRNKKEITQNIPNFSLTLIPQDLPKDDTLENKLARKKIIKKVVALSGVEEAKINDLLDKYGSYSYASLVIEENLDYETALKIYIASGELPGIFIQKGSKRKYLLNNEPDSTSSTLSLAHVLGYLSKIDEAEYKELIDNGYLLFDNIGKTGLEKTYESFLRGTYGRKKVEVDAGGHEKQVLAEVAPTPGDNLILNIDLEAQAKLESALKASLKKYNKTRAAAVALDPRDGSILAMVSLPAFDNNDFSAGISQKKYEGYLSNKNNPLFNRLTNGTYPSGSTIKMVVAAGALQEGIINYNTTFLSSGGVQVSRWFFPDWQAGGHGITNVTKAIAWSVNTFFYYIGGGYQNFTGLGVERIAKYMDMFGLGKKTNIDLPTEDTGQIPNKAWKLATKKEVWYVGDTYNLSIGQGDLLVTPLQVAVWTSAVANGGTIITPKIVNSIENAKTKKLTWPENKKTKVDVSDANMKIIKQGMRECVSYGSCGLLQNLPILAAGKTGTAQWNDNDKQNHAWFTSFAPYENPEIVVTVLIEEGEGGATTAQPVVRDFLNWWGNKYFN